MPSFDKMSTEQILKIHKPNVVEQNNADEDSDEDDDDSDD